MENSDQSSMSKNARREARHGTRKRLLLLPFTAAQATRKGRVHDLKDPQSNKHEQRFKQKESGMLLFGPTLFGQSSILAATLLVNGGAHYIYMILTTEWTESAIFEAGLGLPFLSLGAWCMFSKCSSAVPSCDHAPQAPRYHDQSLVLG